MSKGLKMILLKKPSFIYTALLTLLIPINIFAIDPAKTKELLNISGSKYFADLTDAASQEPVTDAISKILKVEPTKLAGPRASVDIVPLKLLPKISAEKEKFEAALNDLIAKINANPSAALVEPTTNLAGFLQGKFTKAFTTARSVKNKSFFEKFDDYAKKFSKLAKQLAATGELTDVKKKLEEELAEHKEETKEAKEALLEAKKEAIEQAAAAETAKKEADRQKTEATKLEVAKEQVKVAESEKARAEQNEKLTKQEVALAEAQKAKPGVFGSLFGTQDTGLKAQIEELKKKLESADVAKSEMVAKLAQLTKDLNAAKSTSEIDAAKKGLTEQQTAREKVDAQLKETSTAQADLTKQLAELQAQLDKAKANLDKTTKEKGDLEKQLAEQKAAHEKELAEIAKKVTPEQEILKKAVSEAKLADDAEAQPKAEIIGAHTESAINAITTQLLQEQVASLSNEIDQLSKNKNTADSASVLRMLAEKFLNTALANLATLKSVISSQKDTHDLLQGLDSELAKIKEQSKTTGWFGSVGVADIFIPVEITCDESVVEVIYKLINSQKTRLQTTSNITDLKLLIISSIDLYRQMLNAIGKSFKAYIDEKNKDKRQRC